MRLPRLRYTLLGLMVVVLLVALGLRTVQAVRDWVERRHLGASYRMQAERLTMLARLDRRRAREIRECPRRHSPWQTRSECFACFVTPGRPVFRNRGQSQELIARRAIATDEGRALWQRFVDEHEARAREHIAEAVLAESARRKLDASADRPTGPPPSFTREEQHLLNGGTIADRYRSDSF